MFEAKERVDPYLYTPSGPSWPVVGRSLPRLFQKLKCFVCRLASLLLWIYILWLPTLRYAMWLFTFLQAVIAIAFLCIWKALHILPELPCVFYSLRLCLYSLKLSFSFNRYKMPWEKVRCLDCYRLHTVILLFNCKVNMSYDLIACTPSMCFLCIYTQVTDTVKILSCGDITTTFSILQSLLCRYWSLFR